MDSFIVDRDRPEANKPHRIKSSIAVFNGGATVLLSTVSAVVGITEGLSFAFYCLCLAFIILGLSDCIAGVRLFRGNLRAAWPLCTSHMVIGFILFSLLTQPWLNDQALPTALLSKLPPAVDIPRFTVFVNRTFAGAGAFLLLSYAACALTFYRIAKSRPTPLAA